MDEKETMTKAKVSLKNMQTSFMIIAVRLVLESNDSISVLPLMTTRPRPVLYASRILEKSR